MMNLKRGMFITALLLSVVVLRPPQAAAQLQSCGLCDSSTAWPSCNQSNGGGMYCKGVFLWTLCYGCELQTQNLLPQVAPDGVIAPRDAVPTADLATFAQRYGVPQSDGDFVVRRACNGTVTHRWYAASRESELRDLSALLIL